MVFETIYWNWMIFTGSSLRGLFSFFLLTVALPGQALNFLLGLLSILDSLAVYPFSVSAVVVGAKKKKAG
jgi:hypothetical protein